MKNKNPFLEYVLGIKNLVRSKKQSQKSELNWQKFRFNYMTGINAYYRRTNGSKEPTFITSLLKAKKSLNESFSSEAESMFINELNAFISQAKELSTYPDTKDMLEVLIPISEKLIYDLKTFKMLSDIDLDIVANFLLYEEVPMSNICSDLDLIINESKSLLAKNENYLANSSVITTPSVMSMPLNPVAYVVPDDPSMEGTDFPLDSLQVMLEDFLKPSGVISVNVEQSGNDRIHIDLEFKSETLTFLIYHDIARESAVLECYVDENTGKSIDLPNMFLSEQDVYLCSDNLDYLPMDFILSCVKQYIPQEMLNENLFIGGLMPMMEVKYRKVVRGGVPTWVRLKNMKRRRRKILSFAQKVAIRLAQKKAHTSRAERNRAKSAKIGNRFKLYDRKQIKSSVPVKR